MMARTEWNRKPAISLLAAGNRVLNFAMFPRSLCVPVFIAAIVGLPLMAGEPLKEISQHGITWTFDKPYPAGTFVNGDYWVVGPVTITSITPPSSVEADNRMRNGSMINPVIGPEQGYDSAKQGPAGYDPKYREDLNVALRLPLEVAPGSSLISTISHDDAGHRPQISDAAILTVLAAPAPEGSFRPPQTGTDKTLHWNISQVDWTKLKSLPRPSEALPLDKVAARMERPWIVQNPNWTGGFIHPDNNQPPYGRDISFALGEALLSANLDYTKEEKQDLVIRLLQYGIDVFGAAQGGAVWVGYGGHNQGRKMPLIFAGLLFNNKAMLAYADAASHFIFQEDQQTFVVEAGDVDRTLHSADSRKREAYLSEDVGIAEWGEQHSRQPQRDARNWDAPYRRNVGSSLLSHVLVARLMDAEGLWNWPPFFDYMDRYWEIEKDVTTGTDRIRPFDRAMWEEYAPEGKAK